MYASILIYIYRIIGIQKCIGYIYTEVGRQTNGHIYRYTYTHKVSVLLDSPAHSYIYMNLGADRSTHAACMFLCSSLHAYTNTHLYGYICIYVYMIGIC